MLLVQADFSRVRRVERRRFPPISRILLKAQGAYYGRKTSADSLEPRPLASTFSLLPDALRDCRPDHVDCERGKALQRSGGMDFVGTGPYDASRHFSRPHQS